MELPTDPAVAKALGDCAMIGFEGAEPDDLNLDGDQFTDLEKAITELQNGALAEPTYLVWSNEHQAWWRAGHAGYTVHADAAGRYSHAEARMISASARDGWRPGQPLPELPVAEADVLHCEARYRERGGRTDPEPDDRAEWELRTGLREEDLP